MLYLQSGPNSLHIGRAYAIHMSARVCMLYMHFFVFWSVWKIGLRHCPVYNM